MAFVAICSISLEYRGYTGGKILPGQKGMFASYILVLKVVF
jgi:hypothetical protein